MIVFSFAKLQFLLVVGRLIVVTTGLTHYLD